MPEDPHALARVLEQADADRAADLAAVAALDDDQVEYLGRVGELPDLDTVGIEGRCI
jgi:hypothetical protein